jgi:hypothetical protein
MFTYYMEFIHAVKHIRSSGKINTVIIVRRVIPAVLVYTDQYRKQISHNTTAFGIYF